MLDNILISIKPKWCSKILNKEKTIEIRKTKPKLDPPFKVYIYCTMDSNLYKDGDYWVERKEESFIVHGTPNMKFGWELKAKQKGYTEDRLKKFDPITSMLN